MSSIIIQAWIRCQLESYKFTVKLHVVIQLQCLIRCKMAKNMLSILKEEARNVGRLQSDNETLRLEILGLKESAKEARSKAQGEEVEAGRKEIIKLRGELVAAHEELEKEKTLRVDLEENVNTNEVKETEIGDLYDMIDTLKRKNGELSQRTKEAERETDRAISALSASTRSSNTTTPRESTVVSASSSSGGGGSGRRRSQSLTASSPLVQTSSFHSTTSVSSGSVSEYGENEDDDGEVRTPHIIITNNDANNNENESEKIQILLQENALLRRRLERSSTISSLSLSKDGNSNTSNSGERRKRRNSSISKSSSFSSFPSISSIMSSSSPSSPTSSSSSSFTIST